MDRRGVVVPWPTLSFRGTAEGEAQTDHRPGWVMLRRLTIAIIVTAVVSASCGAGDEAPAPPLPTSTTTSDTLSTTTSSLPATTTTQLPTTSNTSTTNPPAELAEAVLIVAARGVYQVTPGGQAALLLVGEFAAAVDDTQGGLLYQVDRGRNWHAADDWDTVVWWIPRGTDMPRGLLVPTPGANHQLSLHDSYETADGFGVVYTRHEGTVPFEDMEDRLRTYDVSSATVSDLYAVRGWEWNIEQASAATEVCVATEVQMFGAGCVVVGTDGEPVTLPGVPVSAPSCWEDEGPDIVCPHSCALDEEGARVAFIESPHLSADPGVLVVRDALTATDLARTALPAESTWHASHLDLSGMSLLYNRQFEPGRYLAARVIDLWLPSQPAATLPMAGHARFVSEMVDIDAPVWP